MTLRLAMLGLIFLTSLTGCTRHFWRTQADFDAHNLLERKQSLDPRWAVPRTTLESDPRSRLYDPFDPDCEPLPPDDPAAAQYMQQVHGMWGYKSWHKFGESMSVENPDWLANFGLAPDVTQAAYRAGGSTSLGVEPSSLPVDGESHMVPTIERLTLDQAIELANINSREYQLQLENVFITALELSLEQFQFNTRYLGLGRREPTGTLTKSNPNSGRSELGFGSRFGMSQLLPTGGQWIVELANNTLWFFSGGNQTDSVSVLSYSLTQPLLNGAGRKIVLEELTQKERETLYDLRTLARYRKLFFADTVVTSGNGGYLGLLRQMQQVQNQRDNIAGLYIQAERQRELVDQTPFVRLEEGAVPDNFQIPDELTDRIIYEKATRRLRWKQEAPMTAAERNQILELHDGAIYQEKVRDLFRQLRLGVTTLDIIQLATRMTQQENQLRDQERTLADSIDQYKQFMGLPTDMQVTLDTTLLKQFELLDPRLTATELEVFGFVRATAAVNTENPPLGEVRSLIEQVEQLIELVREQGVSLVDHDFQRVDANMPTRLRKLRTEEARVAVRKTIERDRIIFDIALNTIETIEQSIARWKKTLADPKATLEDRKGALNAVKDAREDLFGITQNLRVLQVGLRAELITLQDFEMNIDKVVDVALENRLDLMNSRARVMDARRNIEVAANQLEAVLNLVARGDIRTPAGRNEPLNFRRASSSYQFGIEMTAPIDQVNERNIYRAAQIDYQRARRDYMRLEDQIKFEVRSSWRQLNAARQNLETSRKNLRQSAVQLDLNVLQTLDPSRVQGGRAGGTAQGGGNTGLNLLNSLNSVLTAQNDLIRLWVEYERNRINIHRDMDIMEIDERGLWRDSVYQSLGSASSSLPSEPANDIPPASAASIRLHRQQLDEPTGVVRLTRGSSNAETSVIVEEVAGPAAPLLRGRRGSRVVLSTNHDSGEDDEDH